MNEPSPYFTVRMAGMFSEQLDVLGAAADVLVVLVAALKEIDEIEPSVLFKVGPSSFSKLFAYSQVLSAVCVCGGVDALGFFEVIDTANQEVKKLQSRYQDKNITNLNLLAAVFDRFLATEVVESRYKTCIERINNAPRA